VGPPPRTAGVEGDPGSSNVAQQPVYRAMARSFGQHEKLEGYLRGAGFVDTETAPPEFLDLFKFFRESARRQAGRPAGCY
jgi:hypothetical protein